MSRSAHLKAIEELQRRRRQLIRLLLKKGEFAMGSVSVVLRKCGNPRCHCAKGEGHPQMLFVFKDKETGRRRCKLVRKSDEERIGKAGERYREFRKCLKELRLIDQQEKKMLMELAQAQSIEYE